jgi:hypothetical protein
VGSEPTELELRLEARAQEPKPARVYRESWGVCMHSFKRLGELGSALLEECEDCGLVVGVAR